MEHSFDTGLAKEHGIYAAILFKNITFWIDKNRANGKHFIDGKWWTYNSNKAFAILFPYMSEDKVQRTLKKMEESGLIVVGCFNQNPWDKTRWYAVGEAGQKWGITPPQNKSVDSAKSLDRRQIPAASHTDVIPDGKHKTPHPLSGGEVVLASPSKTEKTKPAIPSALDTPAFREAWGEYLQHRRERKSPLSSVAEAKCLARLEKLGVDDAVEQLDLTTMNGWLGVFTVKKRIKRMSEPNTGPPAGVYHVARNRVSQ